MKDEENVFPRYLNESRAVITGFNFGIPKNLEIPDGICGIASDALRECHLLESVTIPGTVYDIGIGAFRCCARLKQVKICEGVTEIYSSAFADCPALKIITIPASLRVIGRMRPDHERRDLLKHHVSSLAEAEEYQTGKYEPLFSRAFDFFQLKEVYYGGTKAQWQETWQDHIRRTCSGYDYDMVIHCTDGDYADVFEAPKLTPQRIQ
ncbi:MAG: leucine-rich repeat domain-containing protein [Treponemataceae bacterium]|nr:leucine-rich repeat domain-containing protein [Treponemataceae bacterium]